jgi:hypothetical protein
MLHSPALSSYPNSLVKGNGKYTAIKNLPGPLEEVEKILKGKFHPQHHLLVSTSNSMSIVSEQGDIEAMIEGKFPPYRSMSRFIFLSGKVKIARGTFLITWDPCNGEVSVFVIPTKIYSQIQFNYRKEEVLFIEYFTNLLHSYSLTTGDLVVRKQLDTPVKAVSQDYILLSEYDDNPSAIQLGMPDNSGKRDLILISLEDYKVKGRIAAPDKITGKILSTGKNRFIVGSWLLNADTMSWINLSPLTKPLNLVNAFSIGNWIATNNSYDHRGSNIYDVINIETGDETKTPTSKFIWSGWSPNELILSTDYLISSWDVDTNVSRRIFSSRRIIRSVVTYEKEGNDLKILYQIFRRRLEDQLPTDLIKLSFSMLGFA